MAVAGDELSRKRIKLARVQKNKKKKSRKVQRAKSPARQGDEREEEEEELGDRGAFLSRVELDGVDGGVGDGGGSRRARAEEKCALCLQQQRHSDGNERTLAHPSPSVGSFGRFNDPDESFAKRFAGFSRARARARRRRSSAAGINRY